MLISTKGRYALRLAAYIGRNGTEGPVSLRTISEQEAISFKYLEQLARSLVHAGLLKSSRGKAGGYRLAQSADQISAGDVLRAVEGTTSPVNCAALEEGSECPRESLCCTVHFWEGLNDVIERYVDGVTVADLAKQGSPSLPDEAAQRPADTEA